MTQVFLSAQTSSSAPAGSQPLEHLPGRTADRRFPPPAPRGAFFSIKSEPCPQGWSGWSSLGAGAPHQCPLPALLLAAPSVDFSGALWMLQGRGVAQPGAELQRCCRVQGRHRGLLSLGMGDRDSAGTYLG